MELDGGFDGKRQSLYSPSPNKPTKRTKSEERDDTDSANATSSDQYGKKIGDIMEDLRELSDDLTQQQSQVRWLIHNTAERQRQECSSKFTVKNWWKYAMNSSRDFDLIERHRNAVVRHYALESGVCDNKVNQFKFSNYVGRNLSPFCIVDWRCTHSPTSPRAHEKDLREQDEGMDCRATEARNEWPGFR